MISALPTQLRDTMVRGEQLAESSLGIGAGGSLCEAKGWKEMVEGVQNAPFCALMLESYKQYLSTLDETTKALQVGNFDKFAFPIISMIAENLVAQELVAVQPLAGPSGLVFYMDFVTGQAKGDLAKGASIWDSRTGHPTRASYDHTSDVVPNEVLFTMATGTTVYNGNVAYRPVKPGTVTITQGGNIWTDDGNGTLSGTNLASGTINYQTGAFSCTVTTEVNAQQVTAVYQYDLEANDSLPQLDFQLTSSPVFAQERKLRGRWSTEAAQVLQALHGLDAEAQVSTAIANEIQFEYGLAA